MSQIKFKELIDQKDYAEFEDRLLDWITGDEFTLEALMETCRYYAMVRKSLYASEVLQLSLDSITDDLQRLEICKEIAVCKPKDKEMRRQLISALEKCYANKPNFAFLTDKADIENADEVVKAVDQAIKLYGFDSGSYIIHGKWGIGVIKSLMPASGILAIEFREHGNHKMHLDLGLSALESLKEDDFRVMAWKDIENLKRLANEKSVELIKNILKSLKFPQTLRQIKTCLIPVVFTSPEWTRWWTKTRKNLQDDPYIKIEGTSNPTIYLLEKPVARETDLEVRFKKAMSWHRKLGVAEEMQGRDRISDFVKELMLFLPKINDYEKMELLAGLLILSEKDQDKLKEIQEMILYISSNNNKLADILMNFHVARRQIRLFEFLSRNMEENHELFMQIFLKGSGQIVDYAAKVLKTRNILEAACEKALSLPVYNLGGSLWIWKEWAANRTVYFPRDFDISGFVFTLLNALAEFSDDRQSSTSSRDKINKIRESINLNKGMAFKKAVAGIAKDMAQKLYYLIMGNQGLSKDNEKNLTRILEELYGEFIEEKHDKELELNNTDIIYVSAESFQARQKGLNRLMTEEIPENSRDIGKAASFGDLSENAEYKAALEKRDVLYAKAEEMEADIKRAKILKEKMVTGDKIQPGCSVQVFNLDTEETERFTFLGPWDADEDKKVFSYLAPFSMTFMNKRINDVVNINLPDITAKYRIESIDVVI
ncbi:MAG: GreA/GreB family elongation factor [bacterium]